MGGSSMVKVIQEADPPPAAAPPPRTTDLNTQFLVAVPTGADLQAAVEKKPELVYSIIAEQHLSEMEARVKSRDAEIESKESDWNKVLGMREQMLEDEEK